MPGNGLFIRGVLLACGENRFQFTPFQAQEELRAPLKRLVPELGPGNEFGRSLIDLGAAALQFRDEGRVIYSIGFRQWRMFTHRLLPFSFLSRASAFSASSRLISPSPSVSSLAKAASLPRNSRRETSPSRFRSILRNHK